MSKKNTLRKRVKKDDLVSKFCDLIRCGSRALFNRAFRWKDGRLKGTEASRAHGAYRRRRKIHPYVHEFMEYLTRLNATALPA